MTDEINVSELQSWSAFLFRLTAFLSPTAEFDTTNWWKDVVGEPPDSQISNPKLFQRLEILSYKNGNLLLEIQPGRIDWIYTSLPQNKPAPTSPDELWTGSQCLSDFLQVMDRWLIVAPPTVRLAFGVSLGIPVETRVKGYQLLQRYLPSVQLDPAGSSDFHYQINRPRDSSLMPNFKINRLSKWVVLLVIMTNLNPAVQLPPNNFVMAHVELDVNTPDNPNPLVLENLVSQFHELKDLALEIAEKGDIP